jgi:hypothetical protein
MDNLLKKISSKLASVEKKESRLALTIHNLEKDKERLSEYIEKEKTLTKELAKTKEQLIRESNEKLSMELLRCRENIKGTISEILAEPVPDYYAEDDYHSAAALKNKKRNLDPRLKKLRDLRQEVNSEEKSMRKKLILTKGKPLDLPENERVYIRRLNKEGITLTKTDEKGYIKIAVGTLTLQVHSSSLKVLDKEEKVQIKSKYIERDNISYTLPGVENSKDLRGHSFEEAWDVSQRWVRYCPQDNLYMGYIGSLIQKKENYQEYLKKEEESLFN